MASVFLLSLALRFWGLGRFNTLVFDEVYYAKFGNNYLTNTPFFDGHPPLGKYIIAIGIWIGNQIPFFQNQVNGLTGSVMSPISYRWINAFSGSWIPVIVAAIAYQISYRRSFALLAGLFAACDGIFIVESRYALINQYIVIFGLLGQLFLLLALASQRIWRSFWLVLSGVAFGASCATKWNGLWFLLGAYLLWIIAWGNQWLQSFHLSKVESDRQHQDEFLSYSSNSPVSKESSQSFFLPLSFTPLSLSKRQTKYIINNRIEDKSTPLKKLTQLNIFQIVFFLGIIPATIYSLIWIPHLQLDTRYGFVEVHKQILGFHERLGNSSKIHPYCSAWYTWPFMIRPMAYFYQTVTSLKNPIPVIGPSLPAGTGKIVYDVHAMGNPFLWWFGAAALLFLLGVLIRQFAKLWIRQKRFFLSAELSNETWIILYIVVNYAANLLPWAKVNRCLFIYHYMTAVVFAFLAIAWLVDRCIRSYHTQIRAIGVTLTFLIMIAFVFWMPIYLGLPLSNFEYRPMRMWFNSWI
ncbi:dolichyl-phosphate-mannose--protein O-mannosyl transferase [Scytonema hofmannii PCC 7110]|uniref:Polyprenol-phosphate-mannose--protein mannosyltransferase n=1 Tax=Scytonema hofmannii PCC 7110 TaxID=128403 RepID=A0A139X5A5_9CYAN|nr:phospholipid carrier-dependent glycosyltransferase [Scytonema hofmannii]KYC39865.1 dolichyl-phosphate-mannose--protein O-mannosyl transferase [Scytonema hofmannii PCC 7110]